jgi:hypothetical protein
MRSSRVVFCFAYAGDHAPALRRQSTHEGANKTEIPTGTARLQTRSFSAGKTSASCVGGGEGRAWRRAVPVNPLDGVLEMFRESAAILKS